MRDVIRHDVLDAAEVATLARWADEIGAWPAGSHVYGQYAEETPSGPAICRTEYVSACQRGLAALVVGLLRECASEALGVDVQPFKDKLNYKQPGGAGFSPSPGSGPRAAAAAARRSTVSIPTATPG